MRLCHKIQNIGVRHGCWGESIAVGYLLKHGYEVLERNVRPVRSDLRFEIDIVAWDTLADTIVFVEVKQHADLSPYARRLQCIDRRKRENLRYACNTWRRINKWRGSFRFDVIEVYGTPEGGEPLIDHINNVNLFVRRERFVKWN